MIQTAFWPCLDQEGSCLLLLCRPVSIRIQPCSSFSLKVSAFRNDVHLLRVHSLLNCFLTLEKFTLVCLLSTVQLLILSTQLNIIVFPSLYPSLLSLKEPSITTIWGKNIVLVKFEASHRCVQFLKIRWLLV